MKSTFFLLLTIIVIIAVGGTVAGMMHLAKTSEISRASESAQ